MFELRQPTNDDFINGVPIQITPEGDDWNPNSSRFEQNEDSFTDFNGNMLQKDHVNAVFINDDDMMEDEWNHEYDSLADIESVAAMYTDPVFTSQSIMYDKEAECASMMTDGVLTNRFEELYKDTSCNGVFNGEERDEDFASNFHM